MSLIGMHPLSGPFVGIPLRRWLYAARIWIATGVALAIAFWLQLDGASTAAVTVSILAVQTRGQTFQKAGYRVAATGVGVVASIVITGLFSQTRDLYIVAVALWLGACEPFYTTKPGGAERAWGWRWSSPSSISSLAR